MLLSVASWALLTQYKMIPGYAECANALLAFVLANNAPRIGCKYFGMLTPAFDVICVAAMKRDARNDAPPKSVNVTWHVELVTEPDPSTAASGLHSGGVDGPGYGALLVYTPAGAVGHGTGCVPPARFA